MTDRQRVLIRTSLGIVLLAVITHTRAAPDLWGHVRFGLDVYSDPVMQKHLNFYYVPASTDAFLAETLPDHIWLPVDLPVVPDLLADGWKPLYQGPRSIWLSRDASDAAPSASQLGESGRRCFPALEVTEGTRKTDHHGATRPPRLRVSAVIRVLRNSPLTPKN